MSPNQQWRDVQAVLRVQAGALDLQDLRYWAARLDLSALLDAALRGERPPRPGEGPRQQMF
jgi:hypothetical protein